MIWWGPLGGLGAARLNGNLVISYWLPGDEGYSGLSLIGSQRVDESICTIFDYLRERGEEPRLVNVPDFVVNHMRYPEIFNFKTAGDYDEYLLRLSRFAVLENMPLYMRARARKFMREAGRTSVEMRKLNLNSAKVRQSLLEHTEQWPLKGINNINKLERSVLPVAISCGSALGLEGAGLYVDDELAAYCLYCPTNDSDYALIAHARFNYDFPRIFDYGAYAFCKLMMDEGYKYLNIHADNGSQAMRALKIALKPDHFFRKYSIEPLRTR